MRVLLLILWVLTLAYATPVVAGDPAPRYGVALLAGTSYDPERIGIMILQGQVQVPYDQVFPHSAPDTLCFKGEFNLGLTTDGRERALVAVNMMAVKYIKSLATGSWTPYIEGGIGLIYTDFQVKGQGLRFNFNPQIGVGVEYALAAGRAVSVGVRLHHLSNADLHRDNRGVNSVLLMTGLHF